MRKIDCKNYDSCLAEAAKKNLRDLNCQNCKEMSNFLKPEKAEQVERSLMDRKSIRETMKETGAAKGSIEKIRNALIEVNKLPPLCQCGKPIGHKAWCSYRVSKSPARQEFLKTFGRKKKIEGTNGDITIEQSPKIAVQIIKALQGHDGPITFNLNMPMDANITTHGSPTPDKPLSTKLIEAKDPCNKTQIDVVESILADENPKWNFDDIAKRQRELLKQKQIEIQAEIKRLMAESTRIEWRLCGLSQYFEVVDGVDEETDEAMKENYIEHIIDDWREQKAKEKP